MTEQLTEKCTALNLKAFAAHMAEALSYAQQKNWFAQKILLHLLDLELDRRHQNRIDLRFKQSKLNEKITIDQFDFDYHKSRKDQKHAILNLTQTEFIDQKKDVILIGHPGVGNYAKLLLM